MQRCPLPALLLLLLLASPARAHRDGTPLVRPLRPAPEAPALARGAAPVALASFDFEGGAGPDPQGWTTHDLTAEYELVWHVDALADLPSPFDPPEGARALWAGARPDAADPILGAYASLPGYGNDWQDYFQSQPFFAGSGLWVTYDLVFDLEAGYDSVELLYRVAGSARWQLLQSHSGVGSVDDHRVDLPPATLGTMVELAFAFRSDAVNSDEDGGYDSAGGAVLDDIRVFSASSGQLAHEDFEGEAIGSRSTDDGQWQAGPGPSFGDFAGLEDGRGVFQEDPAGPNATHFWGFTDGSPDEFRCGQVPGQPAVPVASPQGSGDPADYFLGEIRSPWVRVDQDGNGQPVDPALTEVELRLRAYLDLPLDEYVLYRPRWRFRVGGVVQAWQGSGFAYYGDWDRWVDLAHRLPVPAGAEEVQVALGAGDYSLDFGLEVPCHSHAPLLDDVQLRLAEPLPPALVVTTAADSGPGSLREAITLANADPRPDTIEFDIATVPATIQLASPLPALFGELEVDGRTNPGFAGDPLVHLDGSSVFDGSTPGLRLQGGVAVRALGLSGFPGVAVEMRGNGNELYGSWVGVDAAGARVGNGGYGVLVDGSSDNRIGGIGVGLANRIEGSWPRGVVVRGDQSRGNAIRGNSIEGNGIVGIDLAEDANTTNDPGDTDTGPNLRQNHPVVDHANLLSGHVEGTLESQPGQWYAIDAFASPACSPSGRGEGARYLGSTSVVTDAAGRASFRLAVAGALLAGEAVSATATDAGGNTSEFSPCHVVLPASLVTGGHDSGPGSLREAIAAANASGSAHLVSFDLPAGERLRPTSPLPTAAVPLVVDGYAQPGSAPNGRPTGEGLDTVIGVELDGGGLAGDGLVLGGDDSVVRGLSVHGFQGSGLRFTSVRGQVEGCFLGADPTGLVAPGNGGAGVRIDDPGSPGVTFVGGRYADQRNLISGNAGTGITILATNVRVQGNLVGTDRHGGAALANGIGIETNGNGTVSLIGGNGPGEPNVISGNANQGLLFAADSSQLYGNLVGTAIDGVAPLGNGSHGVLVAASGCNIGTGGGNTIAYNAFDGVRLTSIGSGNRVRYNSIHDNGQLGIDVEGDGVTPAPATYPAPPQVVSVDEALDRATVVVQGPPATKVRVQLFASPQCDPSGYGEGQRYLGEAQPTTDANGDAQVVVFAAGGLADGEMVTATLEVPGQGSSEFSACAPAHNTPAGSAVVVSPTMPPGSGASIELEFAQVDVAGSTTVERLDPAPVLPQGYLLAGSDAAWDIRTTAQLGGAVEVCIRYDPATLEWPEDELVLLHYEGDPAVAVDITTSVDPATDTICGSTASLSPFVLARPAAPTGNPAVAHRLALHPNAPNPFNPATRLRFELDRPREVELAIFDLAGRRLRTLWSGPLPAGRHERGWDGRDDRGRPVASGVYVYRLRAEERSLQGRMVLLK